MNSDLLYLASKHEPFDDSVWMPFLKAYTDEVLVEAFRQVDDKPVFSPAFFWGVCKNVKAEA